MLNQLVSHDIPFYHLRRKSRTQLFLTMRYNDALQLKSVRKYYGCKVKFKDRGGLPHLYVIRKKWVPMAVSAVVALILLFVLSNMIWKVEITGGSPEVQYEVEELVHTLGLKQGNFIQQMDSLSMIEMEIMNKVDNISYVGIQRSGSAFHINIQENKNNTVNNNKDPSDLIATKSGVVQDIYITRGRPKVQVNDFVKKGDVLVTGHLADEGVEYTYSEGTVIAEVWYNITANIDLNTHLLQLIDEPTEKYTFLVSDWEFFIGQTEEKRLLVEERKPLYFLNWELPFAFNKKYYYDETTLTENVDDEQLIIETVENQLKRKLGQSIQLDYYKILQHERDNDKVKLEMFVKVLEDITEEIKVNPDEKLKEMKEEKEDEQN